ncbi:MAG TPA: sugar phosphate isomerase/epimerase [Galbitalea sp.]|jgi:sugar phosphate isomerase/epimerase|nr:sugar phosphate isomerase/epimerase [Galbitalea sp.]
MKFALFSGSTPEWTPETLVSKLAQQGWDGVEWRVVDQKPSTEVGFWAGNRATFPETGIVGHIDEIRKITSGAGLEQAAVAAYVPIGDRANTEFMLAATAAMGAGRVRFNVPKAAPGTNYQDLFAATRADAEFVAKRAAEHGVQVVIQIHHGNIVSTASAAVRLLDGLDPRYIGAIHDLGNLTIEGREGLQSHVPGLQILGPYLAHVHVKNAVWKPGAPREDGTVDWAWEWAPLRTGAGDLPGYLSSLKEVGYDGWVTVEDFTTELPLEERIADDIAYLRASAAAAGISD